MGAVHIYLNGIAERALKSREGGNRSRAVCRIIERYAEICWRARPDFSEDEWRVIREVCRELPNEPASVVQLLPLDVRDCLVLRLVDASGVDGDALVEKLRRLSYPELVAVVDTAERWLLEDVGDHEEEE